jgi:PIN domain nuclease of toxin-antitoxin system
MLDTHVLLWTIGNSDKLSPLIAEQISDRNNEVFVSAISLWEIVLKQSMEKLSLNFAIEDIPKYCQQMGFYLIPLKPLEVLGFSKLPPKKNHKDPFDRMLIYQCIANDYVLVSKDANMVMYKDNGLQGINPPCFFSCFLHFSSQCSTPNCCFANLVSSPGVIPYFARKRR